MPEGRVAALRFAPLFLRAARLLPVLLVLVTTGCVPPPPLGISGGVVRGGSYTVIDDLPASARAALVRGLDARGFRAADAGAPSQWLVTVALSDRPITSGSFAGSGAPVARDAPNRVSADGAAADWIDRPRRTGLFSRGRRDIRLTIRFLTTDGIERDALIAAAVVGGKAPPADMAALIDAAFADAAPR